MTRDAQPLTAYPVRGAVYIEKASGFRWSVGERLPELGRLWISPVVPAWSDGRKPPEANLQPRRLKLVDFLFTFTATGEAAPAAPPAVPPSARPAAPPRAPAVPREQQMSPSQRLLLRKLEAGSRVMYGEVSRRFAGVETTTRYMHMLCAPGADSGPPVNMQTLDALVRRGHLAAVKRPIGKTTSLGHFEKVLATPYESYVLAGTRHP